MNQGHPVQAYFEQLGIFIHHFAQTEGILLAGLRNQANVDHDTARAIFSGVRIDTAKSHINRLREIQGLPANEMLNRAFAQLTIITTMRNDIVHYGANFREEWIPHVTNSTQAMPGRERNSIVTSTNLGEMTADLGTINLAFSAALFSAPNGKVREAWEIGGQRPWLYTPSPPTQNPKPNQRQRQTPASQQGS